jgi:protocatechuate 3,4-dioxygenase beta subunit
MLQRSSLSLVLVCAALALSVAALGAWVLLGEQGIGSVATSPALEAAAAPPRAAESPAAARPAPIETQPATSPDPGASRAELATSADAELAVAIWVEGRVAFPEGTPLGETVEVVANGRKFEHRAEHRAPVGSGGRFRVAFDDDTRTGRLELDAPHLFADPLRVKLADLPDEIVLEPRVGGRFLGTCVPPAGVADPARVLAGKSVRLFGHSAGFSERVERTATVGDDLRFELRGVPPGFASSLRCDPGVWCAAAKEDLRVAPGEDLEVELRFEIGARLSGRVVDESGAPLADAGLSTEVRSAGERADESGRRGCSSAADGTFTLAGVAAGEVVLVASKDGYLEARLELGRLGDGDARERLELRLGTGAVVAGRVEWPDGAAADGAKVQLQARSRDLRYFSFGPENVQETDADGRFRFSGLAGGPFTLIASAREPLPPAEPGAAESRIARKLAAKRMPTWTVRADDVAAGGGELVLRLEPGSEVSGRVVDDTGAPVERCLVAATPQGQPVWNPFAAAVTARVEKDGDGRFVLSGLREGEWSLVARGLGHGDSAEQVVRVPAEAPVTLVLPRGSRLSGLVVDASGEPASKASIRIETGGTRAFSFDGNDVDATSDAKGRFEVRNAPSGGLSVVASRPGSADSLPLEVEVAAGSSVEDLRLALRRPARLTGELRGDGVTLSGRSISLMPISGGNGWQHTTSDELGRFVFEDLTPGRYRVEADPAPEDVADLEEDDWQLREARKRSATVEVAEAAAEHVVLGVPARDAVLVRGTVRRGGAPAPGVHVVAAAMTQERAGSRTGARTDEAGRYELALEAAGDYGFEIRGGEDGTQTWRRVEVPAGGHAALDFELGAGRISGRVRSGGEPVAGAYVRLELERGEAQRRPDGVQGNAQTDEEGRFAFEDLPSGTYALRVGDFGWLRHDAERLGVVRRGGLALEEGGAIEGLEIVLEEAASITGVVRTSSGEPAAGAVVLARDADGEVSDDWWNQRCDGAGRFRVDRLSAGTWTLIARTGDQASQESAPIRLRAGEEAEVDLALVASTFVRVRVEDAEGKEVGAAISLVDGRGRDHAALPRLGHEDGRPGIGPVPPGTYRATATNHDGASASATVVVAGEAQREVTLRFEP